MIGIDHVGATISQLRQLLLAITNPQRRKSKAPPMTDYNLEQGIRGFYASQAEALLAQWKNIEQLLGPTTDFTAPGTHCEVLLRDFLRKNLPSCIAVDKGFVYGRTKRWANRKEGDGYVMKELEQHGPEIDILIHDTLLHRPVFRLEDFAIVQPQAVLAMIQVKRSFQADEFRDAIDNITDAKRHLLEMNFINKESKDRLPVTDVFCAAVEFAAKVRRNDTFRSRLVEALEVQSKYSDHKNIEVHAKTWTLPDFLGSLDSKFSLKAGRDETTGVQTYQVFEGNYEGRNVALQELLISLTNVLWSWSDSILRKFAPAKPILAPEISTPVLLRFEVPA